MMVRRTLLVSVLLAGLAAGCSRRGAEEHQALLKPPPIDVEVVAVGTQPIIESIELNGSLIPYRFANVAAEVDGVVLEIPEGDKIAYQLHGQRFEQGVMLDIGHRVKQGDVLVRIDPTEYELALKGAQARLELARSELEKLKTWRREEERRQLKAQLEEAAAQLEKCQSDLDRAESLLAKRTISDEQYDRVALACSVARSAKERAEAAWDMAEAGPMKEELAIAQAQVDLAEAEVERYRAKADDCTIRAPYDAVVAERYVGVGDHVTATPSTTILQIVDPSILFAQVAVPERYQGRIRVEDEAKVRVPGVTDRQGRELDYVPGIVGLVNEKVDPETRTFRVRVGIDNEEGLFKSGTFAEVELSIGSSPDAVAVPASAVTFAEGQPAVFVLDGDRVKQRRVKLGIASRDEEDPSKDWYEVLKGLSPGERVAFGKATPMLADGMAVRAREAGPGRAGPAADPQTAEAGAPADRDVAATEARS